MQSIIKLVLRRVSPTIEVMAKTKPRLASSYWNLLVVIVVVLGLAAAAYSGVVTSRNIKTSLLERTESLAELVPAHDVNLLQGSEQDLTSPTYQLIKQRLTKVRSLNHDIRFIYIMGLRKDGQEAFFYVDSEDPSSDDYSYPGQTYPEGIADVQSIYNTRQARVLPIEKDRWGVWLSGFSPIKNADGSVAGVMGMDIPANEFYIQLGIDMLLPVLITAFILALIFWGRRKARFQQQFLASKAFFLSFASHEIRSPLSSVAWALNHLKVKDPGDERDLQNINNNLKHILGTVDDVLSMQGLERLQAKKLSKTTVDLHGIITDSISSLELMSKERGTKLHDRTMIEDLKITGFVDEQLFKRVVTNLLVNSLKYSPKGQPVEIALSQTASDWMISIHNEGPGIALKDQRKIFEGFYRTKQAEASKEKGSGFGLMLCHDIIVSHGGKLELESQKDQGVTFKIIMPKSH